MTVPISAQGEAAAMLEREWVFRAEQTPILSLTGREFFPFSEPWFSHP